MRLMRVETNVSSVRPTDARVRGAMRLASIRLSFDIENRDLEFQIYCIYSPDALN